MFRQQIDKLHMNTLIKKKENIPLLVRSTNKRQQTASRLRRLRVSHGACDVTRVRTQLHIDVASDAPACAQASTHSNTCHSRQR
jgi:hypothetical protein